jgi:peptide/nickel transport system permease protein
MTERVPPADIPPQDREDVVFSSGTVTAHGAPAVAIPEQPPDMGTPELGEAPAEQHALAYQAGVAPKARSQWAYARIRFFRHKLAVISLIILLAIGLVALFASRVAPYAFDELDLANTTQAPTTKDHHLFGTDQIGRDYLSRVIFGLRTSLWVALFVALLSTAIGTVIGAAAGYFGGWVDNVLMRFTDLILTLPGLAVLLTASTFFGANDSVLTIGPVSVTIPQPMKIGLILALLFWTPLARIVRGVFLSLREKEYVEAAKASGASDVRIIARHMLPNTLGPLIVNATLVVANAILVEAALSFLGFGIQPPNPALGKLIADGQGEGFDLWWLVTFPGLTIVVIALTINFIGDGLRDALDPTQRRVSG